MANEKQVEMLRRSIDEWNSWRESNRDLRPDLGAKLGRADLSGVVLEHAIFSRASILDAVVFGEVHDEMADRSDTIAWGVPCCSQPTIPGPEELYTHRCRKDTRERRIGRTTVAKDRSNHRLGSKS